MVTRLIMFLAIVVILVPQASALGQPNEYKEGQCELAAKDFKEKFGGSLVIAMPYIESQYIEGKYSGAWFNRLYLDNQYYYFDWSNQRIFSSKDVAIDYYSNAFKNKFDNGNVIAKVFIYGEDEIPFPLIWNY